MKRQKMAAVLTAVLAALFLLRFTTVMTNADFWPESTALALVIIPLLVLLKHLLY